MIDLEDLPRDPDYDDVPAELQALGSNHGHVVVLSEDGVSQDTVVIVPQLFAHARRMTEED